MLGIDVPAVGYEVKLASIARARDDVRQHRTNRNIGDVLGTYTLDEERMIRWRKEKLSFLTGNLARLQWQIDVYWNSEPAFRVFWMPPISHWATRFRAFTFLTRFCRCDVGRIHWPGEPSRRSG